MKTIVLDLDTLEQEIKPPGVIDKYRRLIAEDLRRLVVEPGNLVAVDCPGCGSRSKHEAFIKLGFTYNECDVCRGVYVSPRPSPAALAEFYRNAKSALFWRETVLKSTREARREKLIKPRARWLLDAVDEYRPDARLGLVVGFHNDLLMEELAAREKSFDLTVTNEIADIEFAGVDLKGVTVNPLPLERLASLGPADIFLAFDILDRCSDVDAVLAAARESLAPGGLLLATTTLITGFDLQVLWEKAESIYPPERMNLMSVEGLTALYERHGFEAIEFSTPGMFDVAVVKRALEADPSYEWPRFARYLLENRGAEALEDLQEYLQQYRLSSFARLVLRRRPD